MVAESLSACPPARSASDPLHNPTVSKAHLVSLLPRKSLSHRWIHQYSSPCFGRLRNLPHHIHREASAASTSSLSALLKSRAHQSWPIISSDKTQIKHYPRAPPPPPPPPPPPHHQHTARRASDGSFRRTLKLAKISGGGGSGIVFVAPRVCACACVPFRSGVDVVRA
ncbi:hypothetical protein E2C01_030628 [Portunus trituberculatus]|uniref:Uncharacterized protein n=1 Tax=Portunus trituberculatus TaxID=210409 RepID=A0A5B7EXU6_PORTR|nr:hypothetical protein [Portunus trituberculatus]